MSLECKLASRMKQGCTDFLKDSATLKAGQNLGGPDIGPVLGVLLGACLSVMCDMLRERSQVSLPLVVLRDLPHTYSFSLIEIL